MAAYFVRRALALAATLVVASVVVFLVMEVLPGDPALVILGTGATDETLAALRQELGLDRPAPVRYLEWVGGLLVGDLGISYTYERPIAAMIAERLAVSGPLALLAIALSTLIAVPAGVIAAARHNRPPDVAIVGVSQVGVAIPNFWFAMLLILLFSVNLGWLPSGGFEGWDSGVGPALRSLLMPTVALALPQAAILTRVMRSATLEVMGEDFIRTARAKGLSRNLALWRHALRNALIPVVTIMGLQFSFLLAGTIIIENVFFLPGLGRLIFQAIGNRDIIVVKDIVLILAAAVIVVNFVVDVLYGVIDPRLRTGGAPS